MADPGDITIREYVEMRLPELTALDRDHTVFLISVSPIEVHGPHLPVGTDVFISEDLVIRYAVELHKSHPELAFVKLPPLYAGSDALPVKGSLSVPAAHVEGVLTAYGKGLARQGFHYLFVADNHGGPRHQMATEAAARRLWRNHRFYLIDPFNLDFRYMVQHDPGFMKKTGLGPGVCGDDPDSHAGTNETSLMLASCPERAPANYREAAPSLPPPVKGGAALTAGLGRFLRALGGRVLGQDLEHLANTLAWVSDPNMVPYMGDPSRATREAGEAMIAARVKVATELFERALASGGADPVHIAPMLWGIRLMRRLPE
ncbi:MAG: creatininase family protein [Clostridia bacterium]|nr:creatininase family protein [Clostridia bacterium]